MNALEYISQKYNLDLSKSSPIVIPNMGRNNLAELFAELGFKVGAEIGTEQGRFAEVLLRANPNLKLYCIDPWSQIPGYRPYITKSQIQRIYRHARNRLSKYNCELIREKSLDAVEKFPDASLDFVYIDANHQYDFVTNDLTIWTKKVRPGGIVSGHDYIRIKSEYRDKCDVVKAVNNFVKAKNIKPWFIIGARAKIPGITRDERRSYMWIRQ